MSRSKPYKRAKRGQARFVQLHEWVMATEAWATLKPGPRALYLEVKRRYTGSNNGKITLSHREAANLLNVSRNTVGAWFAELEERGFIRMTQGSCLGPSGVGQTAHWALEEIPTMDGKPATKRFASWSKKQNPVPKSKPPRPKNRDGSDVIELETVRTVPKTVTASA